MANKEGQRNTSSKFDIQQAHLQDSAPTAVHLPVCPGRPGSHRQTRDASSGMTADPARNCGEDLVPCEVLVAERSKVKHGKNNGT